VAVGALILIGANATTAQLRWKADLTEGNIYSLSEGTERILLRLSDDRGTEADAFKLEVRLYQTRDKRVPNNWTRYAKRVEDMLKEYVGLAGKMSKGGNATLILHRINVQPDSPEEDQAIKDNIEKSPIGPEEFAYLGLSLSYADRTEKVQLLFPQRDRRNGAARRTGDGRVAARHPAANGHATRHAAPAAVGAGSGVATGVRRGAHGGLRHRHFA
jgi:hypothetical protein